MINIRKLESELWESADLLRSNSKLTSQEYCMPVLGLIFLRYAFSRYQYVEQEIMKDRPVRNGRVMPVEAIDFQGKSAIFLPQEARYANGICLPEDHPCHVINPACKTIHDGAVDCDYFLSAVLPLQPELNTGVWHEILREEDQTGEGWKACVRCHKPFIPGSNRQRYCAECGAVAKKAANREKQRRHWERQKTVV